MQCFVVDYGIYLASLNSNIVTFECHLHNIYISSFFLVSSGVSLRDILINSFYYILILYDTVLYVYTYIYILCNIILSSL